MPTDERPHFRAGNAPDPQHKLAQAPAPAPAWDQDVAVEPADDEALAPFALRALRIANVGWGAGWVLEPAPMRRGWMDAQPYAYQCPPLTVANQWGWQILCPTDVAVAWDGSPEPAGVRVKVDPRFSAAIKSQFGQGIVTFGPPWLFRTSAGWDLLAKGPSNHWKANCTPLEGVVETWWLPYTFTLNWKIITPGVVTFTRGEPLGQLVPVPHATFRHATARSRPRSAPTRRRRPACSTGRPSASAALRRRSRPTISTARPRESKTTSSAFPSLC